MQPRPPFDRALLIPIAIGVVSILGIGWIFLRSDLKGVFIPATAVPTAIPFDVGPLKTEAASLFPSATPIQDKTSPTATGTGPVAYPGPAAGRLASTSSLMTEGPPRPFATSTPVRIQPLPAGRRYDDTDPNIAYGPYWTALKNPGTKNAYKGTLHASNSVGSEASFRFTGKQLRLGYQRGKNFGVVTVLIDDQPYSFDEQAYDLVWRSPELSPGDHFVRIIHESGESINLDYIEILD